MNTEASIQIALAFIKKWEQLASREANTLKYYAKPLTLSPDTVVYAYPDANSFSIGWGTYDKLSDGTKVSRGLSISKQRADAETETELRKKEAIIRPWITANLTDNQYAAILDFVYNAGEGALKYNNNALLNAINNNGDVPTVLKKTATTEKGSGKVLSGLVNRRKDEAQLWADPKNYSDVYSYYLRNASTINTSLMIGVGVLFISLSTYLYIRMKNKK